LQKNALKQPFSRRNKNSERYHRLSDNGREKNKDGEKKYVKRENIRGKSFFSEKK